MEMTYFNPETLVKVIKEQIIPNNDAETIAKLARHYYKENWTCMGTYIYLKSSSLTEDQQKHIHENMDADDLHDIFLNYTDLVYNEIINEWDITEETEGLEVDSDEYDEAVWDIMSDHLDINPTETAVNLALVSLLELYLQETYENGHQDLRLELEVEVPNFDLYEEDHYTEFDYEDVSWKLYTPNNKVITIEQLKEQY
jgi:hypothetical protein